jgi:hypothetical protein
MTEEVLYSITFVLQFVHPISRFNKNKVKMMDHYAENLCSTFNS